VKYYTLRLKVYFLILEVEIGKNGPGILGVELGLDPSGHFCKFLMDSSKFVFQSKHSSNLGWREY
jgi:hypothetical protein